MPLKTLTLAIIKAVRMTNHMDGLKLDDPHKTLPVKSFSDDLNTLKDLRGLCIIRPTDQPIQSIFAL